MRLSGENQAIFPFLRSKIQPYIHLDPLLVAPGGVGIADRAKAEAFVHCHAMRQAGENDALGATTLLTAQKLRDHLPRQSPGGDRQAAH